MSANGLPLQCSGVSQKVLHSVASLVSQPTHSLQTPSFVATVLSLTGKGWSYYFTLAISDVKVGSFCWNKFLYFLVTPHSWALSVLKSLNVTNISLTHDHFFIPCGLLLFMVRALEFLGSLQRRHYWLSTTWSIPACKAYLSFVQTSYGFVIYS